MRRRILNQYRTELERKVWGEYATGERAYGTRYNLMAFPVRPDTKTTSVMGGAQINYLIEAYESCGSLCNVQGRT